MNKILLGSLIEFPLRHRFFSCVLAHKCPLARREVPGANPNSTVHCTNRLIHTNFRTRTLFQSQLEKICTVKCKCTCMCMCMCQCQLGLEISHRTLYTFAYKFLYTFPKHYLTENCVYSHNIDKID